MGFPMANVAELLKTHPVSISVHKNDLRSYRSSVTKMRTTVMRDTKKAHARISRIETQPVKPVQLGQFKIALLLRREHGLLIIGCSVHASMPPDGNP